MWYHGDDLAIIDHHGHSITYAELGVRVKSQRERSVLLKAEPTIEFVVELLSHLQSKSTIQLSPDGKGDLVPIDNGMLLFQTSGTTGRPKLVGLSPEQIQLSIKRLQACLPREQDDCALIMLPLWHVHGLVCLLRCLSEGTPVILRKFQADLDDARVTWMSLVPTMLRKMNISSNTRLRYIRVASAPLSAAEQQAFQSKFGVPIYQHYGMTEAAHFVMGQGPGQPNQPGSVGLVPTDLEVKIADGVIHLRGANMIRRYLNTEEGFTDDGYLKTGDLGEICQGELFLRGRLGDIINRGGEKINPLDVEQAASKFVTGQCIAVGIPDMLYGQTVGLVVQTDDKLDPNALQQAIKKPLRPDKIVVVSTATPFPMGPTGKVVRRDLTAWFE